MCKTATARAARAAAGPNFGGRSPAPPPGARFRPAAPTARRGAEFYTLSLTFISGKFESTSFNELCVVSSGTPIHMSVTEIAVTACVTSSDRSCAFIFTSEDIFTLEIFTQYGSTDRRKKFSQIKQMDEMLRMCYPVCARRLPKLPEPESLYDRVYEWMGTHRDRLDDHQKMAQLEKAR